MSRDGRGYLGVHKWEKFTCPPSARSLVTCRRSELRKNPCSRIFPSGLTPTAIR